MLIFDYLLSVCVCVGVDFCKSNWNIHPWSREVSGGGGVAVVEPLCKVAGK